MNKHGKISHLTKREKLFFATVLVPLNIFFKLYYADQERDVRNKKNTR